MADILFKFFVKSMIMISIGAFLVSFVVERFNDAGVSDLLFNKNGSINSLIDGSLNQAMNFNIQ